MNIIRPEILAEKFRAAANGDGREFASDLQKYPRLREVYWAFQKLSLTQGGVEKFIANGIRRFPTQFGTKTMLSLGAKRSYADYQIDAIVREIPRYSSKLSFTDDPQQWLKERLFDRIDGNNADCAPGVPPLTGGDRNFVEFRNPAFFQTLCSQFAAEFWPAQLIHLCTEQHPTFDLSLVDAKWFCPDPLATLLQMLDAAASDQENAIARTEIVKDSFDALNFALEQKAFVRLDGNSRYGKSESVSAFCQGRPGLARLVKTHCMSSETDFFQSIAEPLGIEFHYKTGARELRMKIEHIMRYSGLMLVFDEAHFLMPADISRARRPARLDWVRTSLVDRQCPVVIVTTPQVFNSDVARFRRITGYNWDQWEGRIRRHVKLPETISLADALIVVQNKAPDFQLPFQKLIQFAAKLAPNYLAAVQAIVDTARWNAKRAKRENPTIEDVEQAIAEAVPDAAPRAKSEFIPGKQEAKAVPVPRLAAVRTITPAASASASPSRGITPAPAAAPLTTAARAVVASPHTVNK